MYPYRRKILLIVMLLLLLLSEKTLAQNPPLHFTIKDGLLSNTVYSAMQDSKGFVWFNTPIGVNRYDGVSFETFTIDNGLPDNEIFRSFEDSKGRIWFLSFNGRLSYYFGGRTFSDANAAWLKYKINKGFLVDVNESKNGTLWFSTNNHNIIQVDSNVINVKPFVQKGFYLSSGLIRLKDSTIQILLNNTHQVYTRNLSSNSVYFSGTYSKVFRDISPDRLEPTGKTAIPIFRNRILFYTSTGKLDIFDPKTIGINADIYSCLSEDSCIWIGTAGDGLYKILFGSHVKILHLLQGEIVTSIIRDYEAGLWATTYNNGVYLYPDIPSITTLLKGRPAYSCTPLKTGTGTYELIGGRSGDIHIFKSGVQVKTIYCNKNKFNRITDILPLRDSQLVICGDKGLNLYNLKTDNITAVDYHGAYKSYNYAPDDELWICIHDGIFKVVGNRFQPFSFGMSSKLSSVAVVNDSTLYAGSNTKLYLYTGHSFKMLLNDKILRAGIRDIKIIDGVLWIATNGNGVLLMRNNLLEASLTTKNSALPSDVCERLYEHGNFVWIITNKGVAIIDKNSRGLVYNLSSANGLSSNDIRNISSSGEKIYLSTASGVDIFKLNDVFSYPEPAKVYVTKLTADEKVILDPTDVTLMYSTGAVHINYATPEFKTPGNICYQYKVEKDTKWRDAKTPELSLFNLFPGKHNVYVRAKKYNGDWGVPAFVSIHILPLWYQSWWFYLSVAIVFVLLVYFILSRRISNIRKTAEVQNKLQKRITWLESSSLAHQMNPHFIFNSLNTVQQFMLLKDDEGLLYLDGLSQLMRNMLENSRRSFITLKEEVDFLNRYMQLEKIRFDDRFNYEIEVAEGLVSDGLKLPPALFQPLLENAIKYGIPPGRAAVIFIRFTIENNFLLGIVEDNGIGITERQSKKQNIVKKNSTALKVIEERLSLLTGSDGKKAKLKILDKKFTGGGTGTRIELYIPIINGNESDYN